MIIMIQQVIIKIFSVEKFCVELACSRHSVSKVELYRSKEGFWSDGLNACKTPRYTTIPAISNFLLLYSENLT